MADDGLTEFFEPEEGKTAFDDPDQEWYFDLPSGAWERQEQKNRELRQQVKRNNSDRDAASVPFARTPAPARRGAAWQSAGGTWGLNRPDTGDDSGVSPAPLRVPRKEGDDPSGSRWNSSFGDYEAAPEGPAEETEEDEDNSVLGQMRGWAASRAEGDASLPGAAIPLLRRDGGGGEPAGEPASGSFWGGAFGESEPRTKRRVLAPAPLVREGEEPVARVWTSGSLPPDAAEPRRNLWMGADEPRAGDEPGRPRRNLFAESIAAESRAPGAEVAVEVEAIPESPAWLEEPYGPEDEVATVEEAPRDLAGEAVVVVDEIDLPDAPEPPSATPDTAPLDIATLAISTGVASGALADRPTETAPALGGLAAIPLLRRNYDEETETVAATGETGPDGEPTSRWDQAFAGQAVGGDLIDAMREWLVHEKEEEARARDITLLPPELLQPFDWEDDTDDAGVKFEADAGAGVSVASLAGHIWMELQPPATPEPDSETAEDVAAAWRAPVPDEAWEPGPDLARITAAAPGDVTDGEQWGGSSWAELAPGGPDAATKKKGGLLGRLFGKGSKPEAASTGPEWAMGGPSAWTAPAVGSAVAQPERSPRPADWAPIDDAAPFAPEWTPPAALPEPVLAAKAAAPALELALPRRNWDDSWFELPAEAPAPGGSAAADRPARSLFEVMSAETAAADEFADADGGGHTHSIGVASIESLEPGERPALHVVPPSEAGDDPWADFIAARQEEETPFRFSSEGDARRTGSLG